MSSLLGKQIVNEGKRLIKVFLFVLTNEKEIGILVGTAITNYLRLSG